MSVFKNKTYEKLKEVITKTDTTFRHDGLVATRTFHSKVLTHMEEGKKYGLIIDAVIMHTSGSSQKEKKRN